MLKLFNTYTQKLEEFIPLDGNKVKMYVCGPTVYDEAHLGHARCYITWDILYRYLKMSGYEVTYCRNVTDVDDKILKKAWETSKTPDEIANFYYKSFTESMNKLNVLKPDLEPFATKTIGEMIAMVKKLIEGGFAYETDGDVYFRVKTFSKYGQLSKQPLDSLESGARVEVAEIKENPLDFALWKKDEKHGYPSPWGKGRPGWHIECSAMCGKFLGKSIDIHAGGADLMFPHHENELAQSECANGCDFVKYWLHNGFVTVNKEKMSKSLGNFLTVNNLLKTYDADTIRLFILMSHYRMPVEFNDESLQAAAAGVKRLKNAVHDVSGFVGEANILKELGPEKAFMEAMDDDLNTSKALAVLFDLANRANKAKAENNYPDAQTALSQLILLSKILGFMLEQREISQEDLQNLVKPLCPHFNLDENLPAQEILRILIDKRNQARAEKDFAAADEIRKALEQAKIILKDGKDGTTWEIKQN